MRSSYLAVAALCLLSTAVAQNATSPTLTDAVISETRSSNASASTATGGTPTSTSGTAVSACSQEIAAVPGCAMEPLTSAAAVIGCQADDYYCWCENAGALQGVAATGVIDVCGSRANEVIAAAQAVCQCIASTGANCPTTSGSSGSSGSSGLPSSAANTTSGGSGNFTSNPAGTITSSAAFSATSTAPPFSVPNELGGGTCTCSCACGDDGSAPASSSASATAPASSTAPIPTESASTGTGSSDQCAASASAIPTCGVKCITDAGATVGCTDPTDFKCLCAQTDAITSAATQCVLDACGSVDQALQVQSATSNLCTCVSSGGSAKKRDVEKRAEQIAERMAEDRLAAKKKAIRSINTNKLIWPKLLKRQDVCPASSSSSVRTSTSPASGATASTSGLTGGAGNTYASSRFSLEGMITGILALFLAI